MKTTKKTAQPRPSNMELSISLDYNWVCPICSGRNKSRTSFRTEYLRAKCGHCHQWSILDYHRESDAPYAARQLDNFALDSMTSLAVGHRGHRGAYNKQRRNAR